MVSTKMYVGGCNAQLLVVHVCASSVDTLQAISRLFIVQSSSFLRAIPQFIVYLDIVPFCRAADEKPND